MLIEGIVRAQLEALLSVPVSCEVPKGIEPPFVVLERVGGGETNHIASASIALQSYGRMLLEAAALNRRVKAAMETVGEMDEIGRCRLDSDYNWTDTSTRQYRYQAVYDLVYYESEEA